MPGSQYCPVYQFLPRILHQHDLLFPTSLYGVRVPTGLSSIHIRVPTFVTPAQMISLLRSQRMASTGGLGIVHGLTTVDFAVRFSDMARQWQRVSRRDGPPLWQFRGGDVYLEILLNIYILEGDRPVSNDPISQQIFSIIMEHELEHVADEIDIVSRWMPPRAYQDPMVQRYLGQAQMLEDRTFHHWFTETHFSDWLKDGIWAPEHNRRAAMRDSPSNYGSLQRQIEQLRIRQVNQP